MPFAVQRIIFDTNVLVAALISRGIPFYIVFDLVLEQKVKLCISDEVLKEYIDVLNRKKFAKYPDFKANANLLIAILGDISIHKKPD